MKDLMSKLKTMIKTKEFGIAAICAVVMLGVGILIGRQNSSSISNKQVAESETETGTGTAESDASLTEEQLAEQMRNTLFEADNLETLKLGGVEISDKYDADTREELKVLQEDLDKAYERNALLFVFTGDTEEDRVAQIYNKDYQTYCEWPDDYLEFFYDRGKCLQVTSSLNRTKSVTVLDTLQAVLDLAKEGAEGVDIKVTTHDVYSSDLEGDDYILDSDEGSESTESAETLAEEESAGADTESLAEEAESLEETGESAESAEGVEPLDTTTAETRDPDDVYLYTSKSVVITINKGAMDAYYDKFGATEITDEQRNAWEEMAENGDDSDDYIAYEFITTSLDDTFGATEYIVVDGTPYISWYFDTYFALNDWSVDKEQFMGEATVQDYVDRIGEMQSQIAVFSEQLKTELDERAANIESMAAEIDNVASEIESNASNETEPGSESSESDTETAE